MTLDVPGLVVIPDFVSLDEERDIIARIGTPPTISPEKGRNRIWRYGEGVQASGYDSVHGGGSVSQDVPPWLHELAQRLVQRELVDRLANAITVNEYLQGQGIEFHADKPIAGPVISTLGLGSDCTMAFRKTWRTGEPMEICSARRMLIQMTGECRHEPWRHAIYPVTESRYSIVFRWADPG